METALRRMAEMLDATAQAVSAYLAEAEGVPLLDPSAWPLGLWLLLAAFVLLVWALLARRSSRPPLTVRAPDILITQGELVPEARPGRLGAGTLTMTVSNLGRYPVQLLEAASRTGSGGRLGVAEVVSLVPAMGEIELDVRLPVGKLDDGILDLYCYAAATRTKVWRHRADLVWEPWSKRFKVAPLEQRIEPARSLASERRDVVRMDDVTKVEAAAARNADVAARSTRPDEPASAVRRVPVREPRPQATSTLAALLGARRTTPVAPPRTDAVRLPRASAVTPPQTGQGGVAGTAARAARAAAGREASPQARGPTGDGVPGYGLQRAGLGASGRSGEVSHGAVPVIVAGEAPGAGSLDSVVAAPRRSLDREPAEPAPDAAGRAADSVPPAAARRAPAGPAVLRHAPEPRTQEPEDPDGPTVPQRPRDQRLEFPDEF